MFSSYSHYATPGCQSHCKISNNLTRLFAFKSLFLTLCKSLSRAEVFFFSLSRAALSGLLSPTPFSSLCSTGLQQHQMKAQLSQVLSGAGSKMMVCRFLRLPSQNHITNEFGSKREHMLWSNVTTSQSCSLKAMFPKGLSSGIFTI